MNRITVTDRDGWRKEFVVQKSIAYIGSDPANDIVLDDVRGAGVAPRQLQLLSLTSFDVGYRLVNLGNLEITVGPVNERTLAPFGSTSLNDGEQIRLGDYTLDFSILDMVSNPAPALSLAYGPSAAAGGLPNANAPLADRQVDGASAGNAIGLRLALPSLPLAPDRTLEGTITVRNQGTRTGAQFRLNVEGLDPTCYEIGPNPIVPPNAEKDIRLRIVHPRRPAPPAGEFKLTVRASAPEAYPREVARVAQSIQILPYYNHTLRWLVTG